MHTFADNWKRGLILNPSPFLSDQSICIPLHPCVVIAIAKLIPICMLERVCAQKHIRLCVCACVCINLCVCASTPASVCMHVCMRVRAPGEADVADAVRGVAAAGQTLAQAAGFGPVPARQRPRWSGPPLGQNHPPARHILHPGGLHQLTRGKHRGGASERAVSRRGQPGGR